MLLSPKEKINLDLLEFFLKKCVSSNSASHRPFCLLHRTVSVGILRFKNVKAVDRAMKKFKNEEIVVQDVAVQVRILEPGGTTSAANIGIASAEEGGALKRSRSGSNLVNLNP